MSRPKEILKQYWGYDAFRPLQEDIIESVLAGRDSLALLPTGGGKSICFQVPALCIGGLCLVVSPLIALMKDQVQNLRRRNIAAYAVYTGMRKQDIERVFDLCMAGQASFLYISPERLESKLFRARIEAMPIKLLAIDEAHCISQWGYDFRPSYLRIAEIRELLPKVPCIALTATATVEVVADIQQKLAFGKEAKVFQKSYARSNLAYVVLEEENKWSKLVDILRKVPGTGVVYVQNRKATKEISYYLKEQAISADYYHAGLPPEQRSKIQEDWIANKIRIIVATNAFGMGIDKPDVRIVVHLSLPESSEAYFQEAGRGGRDGKKAYAVLLYNSSDRIGLREHLRLAFPPLDELRRVYQALGNFYQLALGAGEGESFDFDILVFCKTYKLDVLPTLQALKLLMQEGYIELSEHIFIPSTIQVICSKEKLYDYQLRHPRLDKLLKTILRSYQGIFQHPVQVREGQLAKFLNLGQADLVRLLEQLARDSIIAYVAQKNSPQLLFRRAREDAKYLEIDMQRYRFLQERQSERVEASIRYAEQLRCRSQMLLAYFGETDAPACGLCDVCLGRHEKELSDAQAALLEEKLRKRLLETKLPLSDLLMRYPSSWSLRITALVEELLEQGKLQRNAQKELFWAGD